MSSGKLVSVSPRDVQFPFELERQNSCVMQVHNNTNNYVAFKVYVTDPKNYRVQPNRGIVLPDSTCDVLVTMQSLTEALADKVCKDKFKIESVITTPNTTIEDITADMFKKNAGKLVEEWKLKVTFLSPNTSLSDNSDGGNHIMSLGKLISVYPQELQFPFELNKQMCCALQVRNNTDNYVAFKVNVKDPKKYASQPNLGIILPYSTCDIIVKMQVQKEAPADMQCMDKVQIQCLITSPEFTVKDITSDMFKKASGNLVDEFKMKVMLVSPPQQPGLVTAKWFYSGLFKA